MVPSSCAPKPSELALRVAIDARVHDGEYVGIQQTMRGLAEGLGGIEGDDVYHFLVWEDHDWLAPALRGPCRPLVVPEPERGPFERSSLGRRAPAIAKSAGHLWESRGTLLPPADPAVEQLAPDLIHFMQQRGFRTIRPNIYQPHDLQHEHLPGFFHPLQRIYRRASYRAMARQADRVAVMTTGARRDVVQHLRVAAEDVIVVPWGPALRPAPRGTGGAAPHLQIRAPERYVLYPAQSWPHKNHEGLVRALAVLRQQDVAIPVVCTGPRTERWRTVLELARACGVGDLLVDLGFVTDAELRELYRRAVALVFPSLYEGWGLPVVEAFTLGVPVACSDVSPLREVAGGAAALFDPRDPQSIAAVLLRIWTDEEERARLVAAARSRADAFSWSRTAELFRAHYRMLCGRALDERERALLGEPHLV